MIPFAPGLLWIRGSRESNLPGFGQLVLLSLAIGTSKPTAMAVWTQFCLAHTDPT
jgi:hypothetical protein